MEKTLDRAIINEFENDRPPSMQDCIRHPQTAGHQSATYSKKGPPQRQATGRVDGGEAKETHGQGCDFVTARDFGTSFGFPLHILGFPRRFPLLPSASTVVVDTRWHCFLGYPLYR